MKITEDTLIAYLGGDVNPHSILLFENFYEAQRFTGVSKRSILRSIRERNSTRNGYSWDFAMNLISEAKDMVRLGIKTQEWFDETFQGIDS